MRELELGGGRDRGARSGTGVAGVASAVTGVTAAVAAVTCVGVALRFVRLDAQSFWYDEAFSAVLAQAGWWELLTGRIRDLGNPPLHPLLLKLWSLAFGSSDAALRGFSAAAGSASIPLAYLVARRVAGARPALLAAGLLAVSPFHVYLGQEARAFALVTLLGVASVHALLRAVDAPRSAGRWVVYAALTFAALYAHYVALFLVPAQLALLRVRGAATRAVLGRWALALAVAAVLYAAAWLPALLAQLGTDGNVGRSVETWHLHAATTPLVFLVGTTLVWKGEDQWAGGLALAALATAAASIAVVSAVRARRSRAEVRAALAWLLPPLLLPMLFSALLFPLYNARYVAYAAPALYLLLGIGLAALTARVRALCLAALLVPMAASLGRYALVPVKHDWRSAARHVEASAGPGEPVVFEAGFNETAYAHYAAGARPRLRVVHPGGGAADAAPLAFARSRGAAAEPLAPALDRLERFWLVLSDAPPADARWAALLAPWRASAEARFRGVRVLRMDRVKETEVRDAAGGSRSRVGGR
jgi:mannosyltransferase